MNMVQSPSNPLDLSEPVEFPASSSQAYYWARERNEPGDPCLNIAARWKIEGPISRELIERGWEAMVSRHEVLRTAFVERNGQLVQHILPHVRFDLGYVDLRGVPAGEQEAMSERLGLEEAARPFDVTRQPLLRITILQQADDRAHMLLTTHHLVGDCWANLTLVREFGEVCDALVAGREPALPDVTMQYGDFASWQNAWLDAGGAADAQSYWLDQMAGLADFAVPIDHPVPATPTRRGDIVGMPIPAGIVEASLATARSRGATLFAFGLTALTALLNRWTGKTDIVVTTQIAGRDEVELETVVGPFINTIALRGDCAGDPAFGALLDATLGTVGEALEHGALPFERLTDLLALDASGRRGPLNGVNFQVLNSAFLRDSTAGPMALKGFPSLSPGAKRDLDVYLVERTGGWRAQCEYDPDLFERSTVEWLVRTFIDILAAAGRNPGLSLSSLPFAPPANGTATMSTPAGPSAPLPVRTARAAVSGEPAAPVADAAATQMLLSAWQDILGMDAIPHDGNFFELGGDSTKAARLLVRVRTDFGRRTSLARFFQAPTLSAMADQLGIVLVPDGEAVASAPTIAPASVEPVLPVGDFDAEAEDWRIIDVRPPGSKATLVGINSVGTLFALAPALGEDRGVVGIRLFEPGRPHMIAGKAFEEIAADYLETIRRVRPHGPYVLFGLCVHGVLALEIAQQMRKAGETVELVAIKNAWHPTYFSRLSFYNRMKVRVKSVIGNFRTVLSGGKTLTAFLGNYRLVQGSGILRLGVRLGLIKAVPSRTGADAEDDFLLTLMGARDGYRPPLYDGRVIQLLGDDAPRGRGMDPTLGWKGVLTGPLHLREVAHPDPTGPNDPGVAEMVEEFRAAFAEIDREAGKPPARNAPGR